MAKVLGIGGVFFKSPDPARLRAWYAQWLGFAAGEYGANFEPSNMPVGSLTVWNPFSAGTDYFAPSTASFMINLIVDDLDGALAQAKEGGAALAGDVQNFDYGRFGWFIDPDGNKVELWQPPAPAK